MWSPWWNRSSSPSSPSLSDIRPRIRVSTPWLTGFHKFRFSYDLHTNLTASKRQLLIYRQTTQRHSMTTGWRCLYGNRTGRHTWEFWIHFCINIKEMPSSGGGDSHADTRSLPPALGINPDQQSPINQCESLDVTEYSITFMEVPCY